MAENLKVTRKGQIATQKGIRGRIRVVWDRIDSLELKKELSEPEHRQDSGGWLSDNVLHPFVNGSGVLQVYNTFAEKKVDLMHVGEAKTFSPDWAVQNLSTAAGAIIPYVIMGKIAGGGLRSVGEGIGARGMFARVLASEGVAQVIGAGAYDFLKAPSAGETRIGNAAGSMAGFAVFGAGNSLLEGAIPGVTRGVTRMAATGAGRFLVGAAGGLVSYDTSSYVSSLDGQPNRANWNGRWESMASGGFINFALPTVQRGATKLIDLADNSKLLGRGVPVDRYQFVSQLGDPDLRALARENPLARVKESNGAQPRANIGKNVVEFSDRDGPAKLAHELRHLQLANEAEPAYKKIATLLASDPAVAERQFLKLRADMEAGARQTENKVLRRLQGADARQVVESPEALFAEPAGNGRTYAENWRDEWAKFRANPSYRPQIENSSAGAINPSETPRPAEPAVNDEAQRGTVIPMDKAAWGTPEPWGATVTDKGINFSIASSGATRVELLIFPDVSAREPSQVLPLFRTGDSWHRFVDGLPEGTLYQYRAYGPYNPAVDGTRFNGNNALVDPMAKAVVGDLKGEALSYDNSNPNDPQRDRIKGNLDNADEMPKSVAVRTDKFDWQGDRPLATPMSDSIIYELNLRGFTIGDAKLGDMRGTYRGLIEKIPYLKELGITAVELMPVFHFDRSGWPGRDPVSGEPLRDNWGYNPMSYQAPAAHLAHDGARGQQVNEFKEMVRELHKNNIEVILDVVYNHSREGDQLGPTISFRGLDNNVYYMLVPGHPELYVDNTGCLNTLNANHPQTQKLILDSLRYWVQEMHVDGFRFDLATIFNYDLNGQEKAKTPIIEAIENDPVLSRIKLIAEPWGTRQYRMGHFSDKAWSEWNDKYRDTVRRFVKSDTGQLPELADRIAGSPSLLDPSKGRYSINFVTAHDGFTLNDLVSYNQKHNERNGQNNRDGSDSNHSWNGGVEGEVEHASIPEAQKTAIEQLRARQIKNMMSLLFLSEGTPMLLYGDEVRRSTFGNNNPWNQDHLNVLDWKPTDRSSEILQFTKRMIELRKAHQIGRLGPDAITWHGTEPFKPDFSDHARFIAWQLKPADASHKALYIAFNAYWEPLKVQPPPGKWHRLVDTNLPSGQDIVSADKAVALGDTSYVVQPRSGVVFEAD